MKTLTEYFGKTLRDQEALYQEAVKATAEDPTQLDAKFGEAVKLEGDKLNLLISALGVVRTQKGSLKRVIVSQLAENEKAPQVKAPQSSVEKDGKVYVIEFFPQEERKGGRRDDSRNDRGDRGGRGNRNDRGNRSDRGDRNRNDGRRDGRGPRRDEDSEKKHFVRKDARPLTLPTPNAPGTVPSGGGERKFNPRPARRVRPPREKPVFDVAAVDAAIAQEPKYMGMNRIKPRTAATLAAKAAEAVSDSPTTPPADK